MPANASDEVPESRAVRMNGVECATGDCLTVSTRQRHLLTSTCSSFI
jgi:hypothetical protein